jgi:hypothetical protein
MGIWRDLEKGAVGRELPMNTVGFSYYTNLTSGSGFSQRQLLPKHRFVFGRPLTPV